MTEATTPNRTHPATAASLPTQHASTVEVMDFVYMSDGSVAPVHSITHPAPGRVALTLRQAMDLATFEFNDTDPIAVIPTDD